MAPAPAAGAGFFPLDAELGLLAQQRYSPRVEETLVQLAAETTFGKAVRLLRRWTGVRTSISTARRRTYAAGGAALAVEAAERARLEAAPPPVQHTDDCLQLSIDATKVQLVGGVWTDVKLASIARVVTDHDRDGTLHTQASALTYTARWAPAAQFGEPLTLEAQRRNLEGAARVVSPNDGALWIQELVNLVAPQAVRILDEPHAAEHLGLISQLGFGQASLLATDWVARQRTVLLDDLDGPTQVLAELDRLLAAGPHPAAPRTAEDPDPAAVLAREVAYFHSRADQIRYVAFRQAGYPIGSGCVESGHKVIIAPRCKRAGMRWAPAHLNPLLVLRTIEANDRWEANWPTVWHALQTSSSQQRQTGQQQRRTLRLLRTQEATTAAPPASPTAVAPPLADAPAVPTVPLASAAPPPARATRTTSRATRTTSRATRTTSRAQRPAPDHPWRRRFLPPKQQRAS